jgi:elongation factor Ts
MVMVEISASMVKELREKSGAAMMDCKKALVEASGDFEKAFEWLRQKGVATAGKKASRSASEGLVVGAVAPDNKSGVVIEVNCETDFVARNDQFTELCKELSQEALKHKPKDADAFLAQSFGGSTIKDRITEAVSKTGENIVVRRVSAIESKSEHGVVGLYVHAVGGKLGALVEISSNKAVEGDALQALAREIAMHVVSAKPQYISKEEVPQDQVENERRIESGKADLADKKPEMRDKIVQGRVDKIMAERCLLEQPFVKDPSQTIAKYLGAKGKEFGGAELKPERFALYILGETQADANGNEEG